MNTRFFLGGITLLVVILLASGCSQPAATTATPQPTAVPTTVPTTEVATTTVALSTPGPTQTLPSNMAVDIKVQRNTTYGAVVYPQIDMIFNGGVGMNIIPEIDMQVTRSDGVVETGSLTYPLSVGQRISLLGTTGNNDRAEVWVVTPQGDRVKIYDQYVPFRSYQ
jgi:hypothetical protein